MTDRVLSVHDLRVTFRSRTAAVDAVRGIDLDIDAGEVLAVVGESGSGKSVTARSVLRLLPRHAELSGGIELLGRSVLGRSPRELRAMRGRDAAMIFQEPSAALDPVMTIGAQLIEIVRLRSPVAPAAARARAAELLDQVGIDDPARRLRAYPHQLSGGQKQRVMIAMAIAHAPRLLIADEPTTALDVTVQQGILELLRRLCDETGMAIMMITHNLGVVADLADRAVVMRDGEVVETASATALFGSPQADYTRELLAAVPRLDIAERPDPLTDPGDVGRVTADDAAASAAPVPGAPVVELTDVDLAYRRGLVGSITAVTGANLRIEPGETVGLVGESGSGKSTLTRSIIGLLPPARGTVHLTGHDPYRVSAARLRALRRRVGMVFQDPRASLNPRMTVAESLVEPLHIHREGTPQQRRERAADLLDRVHLGARFADRLPHELSGGQRQRVSIARALALRPALLVADEPTSALDVSVQAVILNLLRELRDDLGFGCLFVTHDLAVVAEMADRVAVMRAGAIVEQGTTADVLGRPEQDYTATLIAAAPVPDPVRQRARRTASA